MYYYFWMSRQCFAASSVASDDFFFPSLCPFCASCKVDRMHVFGIKELNDFLSLHSLTTIWYTKYGKLRQKYEYHHCQFGCSFQLNIFYLADGTTSHITEGDIPPDHFGVDENPDNQDKDKEGANIIDALIVEHCFAKNYGPQRIISKLCHRSIPGCKITAWKKLENWLYYFRKHKFANHNEIIPFGEKLRKFVFVGDELDEQAFMYHYKMDCHE